MQTREHNKKAEEISDMTKELEALEGVMKAKIYTDLLKTTLKYTNLENTCPRWNTRILIQEIHLYSQKSNTRSVHMPARSTCNRMDDPGKDHIDPETPPQGNCPKQL